MKLTSFRLFLIIIIGVIILILIIIGIIYLIKYIKKKKEKEKQKLELSSSYNSTNETSEGNNRRSTSISISQSVKFKKEISPREIKINAYCDCFLKPVKFNLIKIYNDVCPIDLIKFDKNNEISVTKCNHGFHYNCIKKYLLENESNNELKCPICLSLLFNLDDKV